MAVALDAKVDHLTLDSPQIIRLAEFYKEMLGFEEVGVPNFHNLKLIWLRLPSGFSLHIAENSRSTIEAPKRDLSTIPTTNHICFTVSDFDSFIHILQAKGVACFQKSLPDRPVRLAFFFDPDGNGVEVASRVQ